MPLNWQHCVPKLERSLLAESQVNRATAVQKGGKPLLLVLALVVAVPLVAMWAYLELGASEDLAIVEQLERSTLLQSQGRPEALAVRAEVLQRIEQRLEESDNFYYWVLSGRLNTEQEQFEKALAAYRRADELSGGKDVTLMREYLEVAFALKGEVELAEISSLANRILEQEPNNLAVLGLHGRIAYDEGDYATAVRDWRKVLQALPPGSATSQQLKAELTKAEAKLTPEQQAQFAKGQVKLAVRVAPELATPESGTLFVIARPVGVEVGPPLAVKRLPASDLPAEIVLDNSNLMLPGSSLADLKEISVVARISVSGGVTAQPGDLQSQLLTVPVGSGDLLPVVIDTKL